MVTTSPSSPERQRAFYERAVAEFGDALSRLMRSYERDADKRADLRQEIHFALCCSNGSMRPSGGFIHLTSS